MRQISKALVGICLVLGSVSAVSTNIVQENSFVESELAEVEIEETYELA